MKSCIPIISLWVIELAKLRLSPFRAEAMHLIIPEDLKLDI